MSFQAYLDNIESKTGLSPDMLMAQAEAKGFVEKGALKPGVKASQIVDWLKIDHNLGHGHAMSIVAYFKGKRS